jgi:tRNA modification GTPase
MESGALDAVQAAAFEHLVAARTEPAASFFLRQHQGELSRELGACLPLLESPACSGSEAKVARSVEAARGEVTRRVEALLAGARGAYRLGHPLLVLLAGRPNSGKSTLFNRLAERETVAVSPAAGTTRDLVRRSVAIGGYPIELSDSAGLRAGAADPVEREAMQRVLGEEADAVLYLLAPPWRIGREERRYLRHFGAERTVVAANFSDIMRPGTELPPADLWISALTGAGVDELKREIFRRWLGPGPPAGAAPFTGEQIAALREVLKAAATFTDGALDDMRQGLIKCLRRSWPGAASERKSGSFKFQGK